MQMASEDRSFRGSLSAPDWLVEEHGFDIAQANVYETLFTVGNGYLGTRGTFEEGFKGDLSGTYLNGVFDAHDAPVIDMVNAPNWLGMSVRVGGILLDMQSARVVDHERALDLRQGALWRSTTFEDRLGRRTRIETLRFASFADQHLCALRMAITPENHDAPIVVESSLNGRRFNLERLPAYTGKPEFHPEVKWRKWAQSKHLDEVQKAETPEAIYLEMRTIGTGITIGYAAEVQTSVPPLRNSVEQSYERIATRYEFAAEEGVTIQLEKLVAIFTSRDVRAAEVESCCLDTLAGHSAGGFDAAFEANRAEWQAKWNDCDCRIVDDPEATRAVRFNIYQLLIAANDADPTANIGAKSLSGEGYRGHIFWDTEIFLLPFYIYSQPAAARALMRYRYSTLDGARANARANGFKGAQYAWESADTGLETTPKWTPDGLHRIWTGEEEIHVSADVAYGVLTYVAATGDTDFLLDYGAEILFETSRFWISRLEHSVERDRYELSSVIGPDEFHEHVNNNAFTNRMAQWHLVQSALVYDQLKADYPTALSRISARIGLDTEEPGTWKRVAEKIYIPFDAGRSLIEQFEGYFQLKHVPVTEWDQNDMPCYPAGYDHFNAGETTLLKQPDVLMLTFVLPDEFTLDVKRANYDFYEKLTLHKSSLSPAIHSILGIEVGEPGRALQYFRRSAFVDLANNQGNTQDGIHAASAGGTWQSIVFGFGGFRLMRGQMTFRPWLPEIWSALQYRLAWRGHHVDVEIRHDGASFRLDAPTGRTEEILVYDKPVQLVAGQDIVVPFEQKTEF